MSWLAERTAPVSGNRQSALRPSRRLCAVVCGGWIAGRVTWLFETSSMRCAPARARRQDPQIRQALLRPGVGEPYDASAGIAAQGVARTFCGHERRGGDRRAALQLKEAVRRFFPDGHITVRRCETRSAKGRLRATKCRQVSGDRKPQLLRCWRQPMSRRPRAPRLYLKRRRARARRMGHPRRKDRSSTGIDEGDTRGAEKALARYIAEKYTPPSALEGDRAVRRRSDRGRI